MRDRIDTNPDDIIKTLRELNPDSGIDRRYKSKKRYYEIKTMNDRHHEIVRLHAVGYKNADIADMLGITSMSVSQVLNSSIVKLKLDTIRGSRDKKTIDIIDKIDDMLPDAVKIFESVINGGELHDTEDSQMMNTQMKAAKEVLGIGGYSPVKRTESRSVSAHLTTDDIKALREDADRVGIAQGDVVDCEYEINEER